MKLDKVIKKLNEVKKEHGNIEVCVQAIEQDYSCNERDKNITLSIMAQQVKDFEILNLIDLLENESLFDDNITIKKALVIKLYGWKED